jgi:DeoR/GlpR family transcriptional regulator of sugar metabolism
MINCDSETIISLLRQNSFLKAKEISLQTGYARNAVERELKRLRKSGVLKRVGSFKSESGRWEISEG